MSRRRAREAGIVVGNGTPGPHNAITDVSGVRVGHVTLIDGAGPLRVGQGPVRTGVTVVVPHSGNVYAAPLYAGVHWLNGNGELTGTAVVHEHGMLTSPIGLTNTGSVGVVRDAFTAIEVADSGPGHIIWSLPVVGETWDGVLNDINGQHVRAEHTYQAYRGALAGPVAEGNVGAGTGVICHGFKGGIGTASRQLDAEDGSWTVGVLLQANHGIRERLTILGVPVGEIITDDVIPEPGPPESSYPSRARSIIVLVATDAPLLPYQCTRLARRAALGIARTGGAGEDDSGDGIFAFSTANLGVIPAKEQDNAAFRPVVLNDQLIDPLFYAVIEATEEAIVNALLVAETMQGRDGITAHALEEEALAEVLARFNRGPRTLMGW